MSGRTPSTGWSRSARVTIALLALVTLVPAIVLAAPPSYSASNVGPVGAAYKPLALNDSGQIVGVDGGGSPFYVDSGTVYHPVAPTGATCWRITGLNASGRVAGYLET